MRNKIVQAMDSKFRADLMSAQAKLEVYLENPVGVGEHPDIPGESMKCVTDIVEATEKIKYVQSLYLSDEEEALNNIARNDLDENVHLLIDKMDSFLTALGGKQEDGE